MTVSLNNSARNIKIFRYIENKILRNDPVVKSMGDQ